MAPAVATSDPSRSSDVVMIGCKLPHGIILELLEPGPLAQPRPVGKRVTLAGANSRREDKRIAQGHFPYAVTPVDRSFWNEWMKRNKELEFVVKGFVFEAKNLDRAEAEGKERESERTGMEALAQEKDPRVSQGARVGGVNVETDTDALQRALQPPV